MGAVVSKKKSSSKSTHSGQQRRPKQLQSPTSSHQSSCLYKNKASNVSSSSSHGSSYLQQPQALFDKHSVQSYSHQDTITSTTTSSCRTSVAAPNIFKVESPSDNVHHTNSFFLPDDWDTEEFHHNLHFSLKKLFNGNVTPAVVPVLKKGAHVIQMGTCSGAWIMDMATHYPDCKFTAVELASEQIQVLPELPNITCERGDVLERGFISAPDASVDYIHLRSVGSLVKTHCWQKIFAEIHRVLKPDGVIRIEEMHHSPAGTVMIESFIETLKEIFNDMDQDPEIALKYGNMLQTEGFQVIESKKRRVHYASDGKLSQEFVSAILNLYEQKSSLIAPRLGLDLEDYRHRIEQICSECVKVNAYLEWYSWVGKKQKQIV